MNKIDKDFKQIEETILFLKKQYICISERLIELRQEPSVASAIIKSSLSAINASIDYELAHINYIKEEFEAQKIFKESQLSYIETTLIDSGVDQAEISAVLKHLKKAKKPS